MRIDISLLPALAAAFMLVFARIGAMVMLLPGFGETNIPVRIKLAIALALTLIILPLHRAAYTIDMQSMAPLMVMLVHEIVIGVPLAILAGFLIFAAVLTTMMGTYMDYFVGVMQQLIPRS
jgi:flagellar biosynthetic protein FliR